MPYLFWMVLPLALVDMFAFPFAPRSEPAKAVAPADGKQRPRLTYSA
jgi:hypothetical protein